VGAFRLLYDDMKLLGSNLLPAPLLALGVALTACYPKAGPAPQALSADSAARASTRIAGATPQSLAAGHELFIANCSRCHSYPDLASISEKEWPGIAASMSKKAGIAAPGNDQLLQFILAARSEQGAP